MTSRHIHITDGLPKAAKRLFSKCSFPATTHNFKYAYTSHWFFAWTLELWHFPDQQPEDRCRGMYRNTCGHHTSIRLDSTLLKYTLAFPLKMVCVTQQSPDTFKNCLIRTLRPQYTFWRQLSKYITKSVHICFLNARAVHSQLVVQN